MVSENTFRTYFAEIAYDGRLFSGWQRQVGGGTVQDEVERAVGIYLQAEAKRQGVSGVVDFRVVASGRTDAGVSAKAQALSICVPEKIEIVEEKFCQALNGITSQGVSFSNILLKDYDFDARRSPHIKCYSYNLYLKNSSCGYYGNCAWPVGQLSHLAEMIECARGLVGIHDFLAFKASDCRSSTSVRTVYFSEFTRVSEDILQFRIQGKGFLKQMVRTLVGTLVEVGKGSRNVGSFLTLLEGKNRCEAGVTAPGEPLSLEWVKYLQKS